MKKYLTKEVLTTAGVVMVGVVAALAINEAFVRPKISEWKASKSNGGSTPSADNGNGSV